VARDAQGAPTDLGPVDKLNRMQAHTTGTREASPKQHPARRHCDSIPIHTRQGTTRCTPSTPAAPKKPT
jgi:hypothetical protein